MVQQQLIQPMNITWIPLAVCRIFTATSRRTTWNTVSTTSTLCWTCSSRRSGTCGKTCASRCRRSATDLLSSGVTAGPCCRRRRWTAFQAVSSTAPCSTPTVCPTSWWVLCPPPRPASPSPTVCTSRSPPLSCPPPNGWQRNLRKCCRRQKRQGRRTPTTRVGGRRPEWATCRHRRPPCRRRLRQPAPLSPAPAVTPLHPHQVNGCNYYAISLIFGNATTQKPKYTENQKVHNGRRFRGVLSFVFKRTDCIYFDTWTESILCISNLFLCLTDF